MKIHAAVMPAANAPFEWQEVELDAPRPHEVLIRIVGTGLCHTDLVAAEGLMPIQLPAVLGHEGAGIVEQVGDQVSKVKPGDAVAMSFTSCGHCARCRTQQPAYCYSMGKLNFTGLRADGSQSMQANGRRMSGSFFGQSSFATHALADERNVVKVTPGVPLEVAGTLGCGVQTGAGAIMRSLACPAGSSLLITGGGAVGLSAVMGAKLQGCGALVVSDPQAARRELALSLGASHVVDPSAGDWVQAVLAMVPGGFDFILDTSGMPSVIEQVPRLLAPKGSFGFVGVPPAHASNMGLPGTLREIMRGGFTFRGIIEGDSDPDTFIPELMAHYLAGRFPFDRLVTTYPLADINRAVADQLQGLCIKPVLIP